MNKTAQEIHDQYKALSQTLSHVEAQMPAIRTLVQQTAPRHLIFTGCGSSFNIAQSMAAYGRMALGLSTLAVPSGDLMLHADRYARVLEGAILVAFSRSGSTTEILLAHQAVQALQPIPLVTFTAVEDSELGRLAAADICMPWCFDHSVCQTRSVSCLYAAGIAFLAHLSGDAAVLADLKQAAGEGEAWIARYEQEFARIGAMDWQDAVTLADAELEGIAGEAALAFKEISQFNSNTYHLLDVRHGPMVMIKPDTLVVAVVSDVHNDREMALLRDVAAKGCKLVVCSDLPLPALEGVLLNVTTGHALQHVVRALPLLLVCQMISYYGALRHGTDPDQPDGLDAWIKL